MRLKFKVTKASIPLSIIILFLRVHTLLSAPFLSDPKMTKDELDSLSSVLYFEGIRLANSNMPTEALQAFDSSLTIRSKIFGPRSFEAAMSIKGKGYVFLATLTNYRIALRYYNQLYDILNEIDDEIQGGKIDYEIIKLFYSLGRIYHGIGDYHSAISYTKESVERLVSYPKSYDEIRARRYTHLGNIFLDLKSLDSASNYYRLAIKYADQDSKDLDIYFGNLAQAFELLSECDSAVHYAEKALRAYERQIKESQPSDHFTESHIRLGKALECSDKLDQAISLYHEALDHSGDSNESKGDFSQIISIKANYALGNAFLKSNQLDSALHYIQKALVSNSVGFQPTSDFDNPKIDFIHNREYFLYIIQDKAQVFQKFYKEKNDPNWLRKALECYETADSVILTIRKSFIDDESKLFLSGNLKGMYEEAIGTAYDLYNTKPSLELIDLVVRFMEKNKSLTLLESLRDKQILSSLKIPDNVRDVERSLLESYTKLSFGKPEGDPQKQSEIFAVREKINSWYAEIENQYPAYKGLKNSYSIATLEDFSSLGSNSNSGVVAYFFGEKNIYSISVFADNYSFKKHPNPELSSKINEFLKVLTNTKAPLRDLATIGNDLYNRLLSGMFGPKLPSSLIIIPDGKLSYLPFETLIVTAGQKNNSFKNLDYLVNRSELSYGYSLSLLLTNEKEKSNNTKMLAFGFGADDALTSSLTGSELEVQHLSTLFDGEFLSGKQATRKSFFAKLEAFGIIHLALHVKSDSINPLNSQIFFRHAGNTDSLESVFNYELYNLRLNCDLLVANSCDTGIGKNFPGEGVYSLSRTFTHLGCPSIVNSLWELNDNSTSYVTRKFYEYIAEGENKRSSLSKAKKAYIQQADELTSHPYHWAGLIIVGDTNPLNFNNRFPVDLTVIVLVVVLISLLIFWNRKTN